MYLIAKRCARSRSPLCFYWRKNLVMMPKKRVSGSAFQDFEAGCKARIDLHWPGSVILENEIDAEDATHAEVLC